MFGLNVKVVGLFTKRQFIFPTANINSIFIDSAL